jgi:hypothetical protein
MNNADIPSLIAKVAKPPTPTSFAGVGRNDF